ncbi:MAG: hypothetical protein AAB393_17230, partial [Bacteroidota bacterium]
VPLKPLPGATTPEQKAFNQAAEIMNDAEGMALRANRENYLALKQNLSSQGTWRRHLMFALKVLVGLAVVVQLAALAL